MRIAAAQTTSLPGDVAANLQTHLRFAEAAAAAGVQVLVFPELSLTGYDLPGLARQAAGAGDAVFAPLRDAARRHGMALVVGAPARREGGARPGIGAFTFHPDGRAALYCKRHLHPGEEVHAGAGTEDVHLAEFAGVPTALAVCADISHGTHADAAARSGAAVYAAGVVISEGGYAQDSAHAQGHAERCRMAVLLANHGAPTGGYRSAGRSSFRAPGGALLAEAPGTGDWLVIAHRDASGWSARAEPVAAP
ncbi:carbon-nitrogen hydrolase family protein [Paracidovorax anthurii]|uniref:Putative amidohydrolase n=1 Tax=Paracidovorax anthurii TaxID=78229 RepID=A0A328Z0D6_9BURK|nr:carbon-nitrogen hydrolase family protein [Paracidovorax anthurii]RAR78903.1 putative amidohydrolase [Paracidovorax anthurii]